uniref:leiomodin-3 n=1 Tax=Myxine glutinosa TaxID=7769 RepID=UPI00358FEA2A
MSLHHRCLENEDDLDEDAILESLSQEQLKALAGELQRLEDGSLETTESNSDNKWSEEEKDSSEEEEESQKGDDAEEEDEEEDEETLLAELSQEQLQQLEQELEELSPESSLPIGQRQRDHSSREPEAGFNRYALREFLQREQHILEAERVPAVLLNGQYKVQDRKEVCAVKEEQAPEELEEVQQEKQEEKQEEEEEDLNKTWQNKKITHIPIQVETKINGVDLGSDVTTEGQNDEEHTKTVNEILQEKKEEETSSYDKDQEVLEDHEKFDNDCDDDNNIAEEMKATELCATTEKMEGGGERPTTPQETSMKTKELHNEFKEETGSIEGKRMNHCPDSERKTEFKDSEVAEDINASGGEENKMKKMKGKLIGKIGNLPKMPFALPGLLSGNPTIVEDALRSVKKNDPSLTDINLNNIEKITSPVLVDFAEALKRNKHVRKFSITNTHADDSVAFALANMIRENRSLTHLNLDSNFISSRGTVALVRCLQFNETLTELRFHNQRHMLGMKAEMEISRLLKFNYTLLKLGYHFELPGPRMVAANILTRNLDRQRQLRRVEQQRQEQEERCLGFQTSCSDIQAGATPPQDFSPEIQRRAGEVMYQQGNESLGSQSPARPSSPAQQKKAFIDINAAMKASEAATARQKPKVSEARWLRNENDFRHVLQPLSKRKVKQNEVPKNTCLHEELMSAIHSSNVTMLRPV